jgi:hypothetical protein
VPEYHPIDQGKNLSRKEDHTLAAVHAKVEADCHEKHEAKEKRNPVGHQLSGPGCNVPMVYTPIPNTA